MSSDILIAIIPAASVVIAAGLRLAPRRNPRDDIERDLQIAERLPSDSKARKSLVDSVEARVEQVAAHVYASRDWLGVSLGIAFLAGFGGLSWWMAGRGGWWWSGAVPLGIAALIMIPLIVSDARKTLPTDPDGKGAGNKRGSTR